VAHVARMMKVDTLPDELGKTARYFSVRVASRVQGERVLVFLREFERGVVRKNGQFTRKGGMKINAQCIDYFVAIAPE
jgi:hypothetical protein